MGEKAGLSPSQTKQNKKDIQLLNSIFNLSSWIIIFWIVKTSYSWTNIKYNWEFHVEDCEEQKSHKSGVLLPENYLHGKSFNSNLSHPDLMCSSLRLMKSFKFKRKGFENYIPWAFCHWKFPTLTLIPRENMKTWHCNCPRVSSGATATGLPLALEVRVFSSVTFPRHHKESHVMR